MQTTLDKLKCETISLVTRETERDPIPAAIARMCAARAGKPITKRDTAALETEFPGLHASIKRDGTSRIQYWTAVSVDRDGSVHGTARLQDVHSSWVLDANGDSIRDVQGCADQVALHSLGVPRGSDCWGVKVSAAYNAGGVLRWPTLNELHDMNPSHYSARDERNAARAESLSRIASDSADLANVARLVDEINLMAQELRGFLDTTPPELARVAADSLTVVLDGK